MAISASAGLLTSRYCCSGLSAPVTEKLGGATWPVVSPTATCWPSSTPRDVNVPLIGAKTFAKLVLGLPCVSVGNPSGPTPSTGSGTVTTLMS